ncbi:MAG TPA: ABC transporter permease [Clostridia bacterium]|nr:ABC transporter permease [Clostridia bacterium]
MKKVQRIEMLFELLRVVLGLIIAYAISIVFVMLASGESAGEAVYNFAVGPFANARRFGQLMGKYIPYVLMGCGFCFIYSAGRFSLIGEGIVNFAPIIMCLVMFNTNLMTSMPSTVNLIFMVVVCAAIGGLIAMIPAYTRERLGQSEMVISIIMNYMLFFLSMWVLKMWLVDREASMQSTQLYPDNMRFLPLVGTTNFHSGIIVSVIGWVIAVFMFGRMKIGQKIRTCGANPSFAKYSGINAAATVFIAQIIGGMFAGAAACVDAFGMYSRYQYNALTNIGFDGLLVAVIARKKPIFVPLAAFVLAYIRTSAVVLNLSSSIPVEFVNMMQAILIFFVAAEHFLSKSKKKVIFSLARKTQGVKL